MSRRLSAAGRLALSFRAAFTALSDPQRADMVATLAETTSGSSLPALLRRMQNHTTGARILAERPIITEQSINMARLRTLPLESVGRQYALYMDSHGFSPDARPAVAYIEDQELAYVMSRYRQVHDFWHVLSGLPPTELGEISLKWFEAVQTGLPMCFVSAVVGPVRLGIIEKEILVKKAIPWAISAASNSVDLLCVHYEDHLDSSLDELRAELAFVPYSEELYTPTTPS